MPRVPVERSARDHVRRGQFVPMALVVREVDTGHEGRSPLHAVFQWTKFGRYAPVARLLLDAVALPNARTERRRTPLRLAVDSGVHESVDRPLARGAHCS